MKKLLRLTAVICFLVLVACQNNRPTLVGNWQAAKVSENGDSLAIDPSLIRFYFSDAGRYRFESTLNYVEAGHYRWDSPFLFTLDTSRTLQSEKAVRIDWVSMDTLRMEMEDGGQARELVLIRQ